MRKNTKIIILCCAFFLTICSVAALLIRNDGDTADAVYSTPEMRAETTTGDTQDYVLRIYDGRIAVYHGEFPDAPTIETEIEAAGLREVDRIQLERGIGVKTYEEVLQLLEDFGS
jgi:hypothetical protein